MYPHALKLSVLQTRDNDVYEFCEPSRLALPAAWGWPLFCFSSVSHWQCDRHREATTDTEHTAAWLQCRRKNKTAIIKLNIKSSAHVCHLFAGQRTCHCGCFQCHGAELPCINPLHSATLSSKYGGSRNSDRLLAVIRNYSLHIRQPHHRKSNLLHIHPERAVFAPWLYSPRRDISQSVTLWRFRSDEGAQKKWCLHSRCRHEKF